MLAIYPRIVQLNTQSSLNRNLLIILCDCFGVIFMLFYAVNLTCDYRGDVGFRSPSFKLIIWPDGGDHIWGIF